MWYLRESTVIPEISFMGETVSDETKLVLLYVLLNRVQGLFFGDLKEWESAMW